MLKREASLQGNSRASSTGGKTLPEQTEEGQERRESGRGRLRGEREQRRRAPNAGWELPHWLRAVLLPASTEETCGGNAKDVSPL